MPPTTSVRGAAAYGANSLRPAEAGYHGDDGPSRTRTTRRASCSAANCPSKQFVARVATARPWPTWARPRSTSTATAAAAFRKWSSPRARRWRRWKRSFRPNSPTAATCWPRGCRPSRRPIVASFPQARYNPVGRTFRIAPVAPRKASRRPDRARRARILSGRVAIVTAGTSDLPVAEEARETALWTGAAVTLMQDVGVAGPHRLAANLPLLANGRRHRGGRRHGRGAAQRGGRLRVAVR